jgi:hypothetical protein
MIELTNEEKSRFAGWLDQEIEARRTKIAAIKATTHFSKKQQEKHEMLEEIGHLQGVWKIL